MKKKKIKFFLLSVMIILSNILIIRYASFKDTGINLEYQIKANQTDTFQIFYSDGSEDWKEENSEMVQYSKISEFQKLQFSVPKQTTRLRIDFGTMPSEIQIKNISLKGFVSKLPISTELFNNSVEQNELVGIKQNEIVIFRTTGNDPYVIFDIPPNSFTDLQKNKEIADILIKIVSCILIDGLLLVVFKKSKSVLQLANELNNNRTLIWNLAKNDFKTKYAGSYLGIIWAFIQPIVTILIYWFVFGFGLRAGSPIEGVPFIFWFMAGLIPWFFFQDALLNATNCMVEYSYLVKKVVFKISVLPIIKIISAVFVHLVFVGVLLVVGGIYGFYPGIKIIQLVYYSFCTFFLVLGISYATSAIVLFFKDLSQLISIFLQIGMWMTPIMWSYTIIPSKFQWIAKLNPMFYIVEGYRDTLIGDVWFWQRYFQTIYFWGIALFFFAVGALIFKKLKPHFSDVL